MKENNKKYLVKKKKKKKNSQQQQWFLVRELAGSSSDSARDFQTLLLSLGVLDPVSGLSDETTRYRRKERKKERKHVLRTDGVYIKIPSDSSKE